MHGIPPKYLRFGSERLRPAVDLLARVPLKEVSLAADLGCGTGTSTELLAARWPEAAIVGVDHSIEMVEAARQAHPHWQWVTAEIEPRTAREPLDLLFSNAALHWVKMHGEVFPRLLRQVRSGGVLAVQIPRNFAAPSHHLMRVAGEPWSHILPVEPAWSGDASFYYDLLAPLATTLDIWETEYHHVMDSAESILHWVRGSALRPYLEALDPADRPIFEASYLELIKEAYPPQTDGKVLLPFRRLFVVAVR